MGEAEDEDDKKESDDEDMDDEDLDEDSDSQGNKNKPSLSRAGSRLNNVSSGNIFDIDFGQANKQKEGTEQRMSTLNHLLKKPSLEKAKVGH